MRHPGAARPVAPDGADKAQDPSPDPVNNEALELEGLTSPSPWPLGGYAPGRYMCKCRVCGMPFDGDKRAMSCLPCAVAQTRVALKSAQAELTQEALREALRAAKREMWDIARHTWALADFENWAVIQQIDAALRTPAAGDA